MCGKCGAAISYSGVGDSLARKLVEVPEVNWLIIGVRIPLIAGSLPRLAKAVASELGVEVDVTNLLRVLWIFGNVFVKIVHFFDVVIETLS